MALPARSDILTGKFSADGSPWVRVAKSGVNTDTLIFSADGSPWRGIGETASATWKLFVGGTRITTMYVGSTEVTTAYLGGTAIKS
jgi:hypothetical protein